MQKPTNRAGPARAEGLNASLAAAQHKLADLDRGLAARRTTIDLGQPGFPDKRRPNHHRKGRIVTDTADLTAALRAHARGLHTSEAAIELLIGHASWLRRTDFVDPFVHIATGLIDGTPIASIGWGRSDHRPERHTPAVFRQ